ncbi:hypothetical protein DTO282F9_1425 [Paecilomyces variotii]|nr:hypothetical protein DTO282E5_956 [Paecilomyces variotii]KAJ9401655.1 hypothetical protein DTO282F9_1425 [Paecilomyces variotii]
MEDDLLESLSSLSSSLSSAASDLEELYADEVNSKQKLSTYTPQSSSDDTAKVLESFIEHLPFDGKRIITKFIASLKAEGGKTPSVTPSPFENADITFEEVSATMVESSSRKDQKALKKTCLERDNYRCVVTGFWDEAAQGKIPEEIMGDRILNTELVHIIPFSLGKYDNNRQVIFLNNQESSKSELQERDIARCWTTLYILFPDLLNVAQLGPDNINDPTNAMSMLAALHTEFGRLRFALESTVEENTYKIKTYPRFQRGLIRDLPPPNQNNERLVKFEKYSNCNLPSRVLLDTHAVIARILHASGKAEEIDKIFQEREQIRCLAADGSTDLQRLLLLV